MRTAERLRQPYHRELVACHLEGSLLPFTRMLERGRHHSADIVHSDHLQARGRIQWEGKRATLDCRSHIEPVLHKKDRPQNCVPHPRAAEVFLDAKLTLKVGYSRPPVGSSHRTIDEVRDAGAFGGVDQVDALPRFGLHT